VLDGVEQQDRGVPDLESATPALRHLTERLHDNLRIVAHCRFQIGRASLIAAAILVATGTEHEQAWLSITTARGLTAPDTTTQRTWITQLARRGQDS
jgi:protein-tyrosine phosphatase